MSDVSLLTDEKLAVFELERINAQLPQLPMVTEHEFCSGVYARTLHIPAGALVTGAIHKDESFFVLREGRLLVSSGSPATEVNAGFMAITQPGEKRIVIAVSNCVVTTFHANPQELREPEEIWEHYTIEPPANLLEMLEKRKLEASL